MYSGEVLLKYFYQLPSSLKIASVTDIKYFLERKKPTYRSYVHCDYKPIKD